MKYLYLVDYWVPFPSSEYGGLVTLIAESDTEAFDLLSAEEQFDERYQNKIMEYLIKAQKFALVDEFESGILEAFVT